MNKVNDFVVKFANVNGSGSASANLMFAKSIFRMGVPVTPKNIFPSNIQGLPTWFEVRISKDGSIEEIGQKPNSLAEIQGQYMGLLKFSPEGLRLLRDSFSNYKKNGLIMDKTCENAFMTDLLMQLIVDKIKIQSVKVFSPWIEVDTVDDLHASYTTKRIRMIENNM